VGVSSKARGVMRTGGNEKFSGTLEVASRNRLLRFLAANVAKAYDHTPEITLCPTPMPQPPTRPSELATWNFREFAFETV
jgi:hypothetical protein